VTFQTAKQRRHRLLDRDQLFDQPAVITIDGAHPCLQAKPLVYTNLGFLPILQSSGLKVGHDVRVVNQLTCALL
jgi:hypothetical protein